MTFMVVDSISDFFCLTQPCDSCMTIWWLECPQFARRDPYEMIKSSLEKLKPRDTRRGQTTMKMPNPRLLLKNWRDYKVEGHSNLSLFVTAVYFCVQRLC